MIEQILKSNSKILESIRLQQDQLIIDRFKLLRKYGFVKNNYEDNEHWDSLETKLAINDIVSVSGRPRRHIVKLIEEKI